ncbi:GNAT family N-acetyltransferase [Micromonospora sp. NBC_01796]|uniref:GNAT family N-acetyltransferase n=1 Tax=Micromonospora sp. NBC_01796 TaxID=2975987 RepID=UPI002DDA5F00|nr:GNAT family N-acetyltransferase [Micromonospora sp. NBC_01796]WSA82967.1 GNAT family N-acetyltransferase [Micromonospora sp. NBC_01796]
MTHVLRVDATSSTPALLLRPWLDTDAEALIEAYRDPVLRRWTRSPVADAEDAVRWLAVQGDGWRSRQRHSFAVLEDLVGDDNGGRLLGNVALKAVDPTNGSAEVGYWTAAYARGRGIAPVALEALTRWAFDTFAPDGLTRLDLLHQVDNVASCRVAEKAGYAFEQVMAARPPFPNDGHLHLRHAARPIGGAGVTGSSGSAPSSDNRSLRLGGDLRGGDRTGGVGSVDGDRVTGLEVLE